MAFLATPFVLLLLPTGIFVSFAIVLVLGVSLLLLTPSRAVGIGLLAGTITTFAALSALATALGGAD